MMTILVNLLMMMKMTGEEDKSKKGEKSLEWKVSSIVFVVVCKLRNTLINEVNDYFQNIFRFKLQYENSFLS